MKSASAFTPRSPVITVLVVRVLSSLTGHPYSLPSQDTMPSLQDIASPAEYRRLQEYRSLQRRQASDNFICDIAQEPEFGGQGRLVPCLVSRGKIVNCADETLALGLEHLLMMGHRFENPFACNL